MWDKPHLVLCRFWTTFFAVTLLAVGLKFRFFWASTNIFTGDNFSNSSSCTCILWLPEGVPNTAGGCVSVAMYYIVYANSDNKNRRNGKLYATVRRRSKTQNNTNNIKDDAEHDQEQSTAKEVNANWYLGQEHHYQAQNWAFVGISCFICILITFILGEGYKGTNYANDDQHVHRPLEHTYPTEITFLGTRFTSHFDNEWKVLKRKIWIEWFNAQHTTISNEL